MSTPQTPPTPEEQDPAAPPPPADDWILARASPLLGLTIAGGFAVGVLAGIVRDLPPGLAGVVTVLIGARVVGKIKR